MLDYNAELMRIQGKRRVNTTQRPNDRSSRLSSLRKQFVFNERLKSEFQLKKFIQDRLVERKQLRGCDFGIQRAVESGDRDVNIALILQKTVTKDVVSIDYVLFTC